MLLAVQHRRLDLRRPASERVRGRAQGSRRSAALFVSALTPPVPVLILVPRPVARSVSDAASRQDERTQRRREGSRRAAARPTPDRQASARSGGLLPATTSSSFDAVCRPSQIRVCKGPSSVVCSAELARRSAARSLSSAPSLLARRVGADSISLMFGPRDGFYHISGAAFPNPGRYILRPGVRCWLRLRLPALGPWSSGWIPSYRRGRVPRPRSTYHAPSRRQGVPALVLVSALLAAFAPPRPRSLELGTDYIIGGVAFPIPGRYILRPLGVWPLQQTGRRLSNGHMAMAYRTSVACLRCCDASASAYPCMISRC